MNLVKQIKSQIVEQIILAVSQSGLVAKEEIPAFVLEIPKEKSHGDFATNIAMQLTRIAKKPPRIIAEEIIKHFNQDTANVQKVEIAGPGFINFFIDPTNVIKIIPSILEWGEAYGQTEDGKGKKVQIEFVSANPTGSLHLGHARGAAVGDTLCNIMNAAGYEVSREYYINDAGNQVHNLALSLEARYFQSLKLDKEMPEDGYYGEDIVQFGQDLAKEYGDKWIHTDESTRYDFLREYGLKRELEKLKNHLQQFRVEFDVWFSETSLYTNNKVKPVLESLKQKGETFEEDGATWFRSTTYGDDKDRVLIKQDGSFTYITPDIAYHQDKLNRGFDQLINIWGADHHGYIPRMKAAIQALGYSAEQLEVIIIQMVNLYQNGEKMKMSKRTGKAVTLLELMEEVGVDAMRYFFAMRSADTHLDFDMDLAISKSNENPVFYIQYAHARICSMLRQGKEMLLTDSTDMDWSLISSEKEIDMMKKLAEFPEVIADAAEKLTPHKITQYTYDLAAAFHSFYNAERVLDEEEPLKSKVRLKMIKAVQITLQNALSMIGVSAPERM